MAWTSLGIPDGGALHHALHFYLMMNLSIIVPTFRREAILVETLDRVIDQLGPGDEVIVIDQTPEHEAATERRLTSWAREGTIRWYHKRRPGQTEAMNVGALLANGTALVFLDDDVVPSPEFLAAYRQALTTMPDVPAFCGQVLQPWHVEPLDEVVDFGLGFDPAYGRPCEACCLMEGNFAIRRQTFLELGGMDENFAGCTYRHGTELAYRIRQRLGRLPRFLPAASLRHLYAGGGQRAHGAKDSWGHLGASTGDYYFAWRCLGPGERLVHGLRRWFRATFNRRTVMRPWLMPSMALREVAAWWQAVWLAWRRPGRFIRPLDTYEDCRPWEPCMEAAAREPLPLATQAQPLESGVSR